MEDELKVAAIYKLALAGERAGYSVDEMIEMLRDGLSVENLLYLIERQLRLKDMTHAAETFSSTWVM